MDIKRGDIWYIESGYATRGSEQRPGRPAVVVSNNGNNQHSTTVEVVYLTTQPKRDLPTHVVIRSTGQRSIALCEQVTTISTERIGDYCGRTTDNEMAYIENALMISLGISISEEQKPVNEEIALALVSQFTEVQARCTVLQEMYDALLNRLIKAS